MKLLYKVTTDFLVDSDVEFYYTNTDDINEVLKKIQIIFPNRKYLAIGVHWCWNNSERWADLRYKKGDSTYYTRAYITPILEIDDKKFILQWDVDSVRGY
jgi:hypothetical protein